MLRLIHLNNPLIQRHSVILHYYSWDRTFYGIRLLSETIQLWLGEELRVIFQAVIHDIGKIVEKMSAKAGLYL